MMTDARIMSTDELKAFLASSGVFTFKGNSREEIYAWVERTLRSYSYRSRPRLEKGLLRRCIRKMTGISNSQLTRLITQFRRSGQVRIQPYQRHSFPNKYTREDQLLLAEVDTVHQGDLNGAKKGAYSTNQLTNLKADECTIYIQLC